MNHGYRAGLFAVPLLLSVVAALGGCTAKGNDGPGVASAGGTFATGAASAAPEDDAALGRRFAQCMRGEGVDMPDPGPNGGLAMPATRPEYQEAMKKTEAAGEKCREFLPNGGEPPKASAEDLAKARDYAKCIRDNGIPGFPDPDPRTGQFEVDADKADEIKDLAKIAENCGQFGAGVMPGVQVAR